MKLTYIILILSLFLSNCSPVIKPHGYQLEDILLSEPQKIGISSKADIMASYGSPSIKIKDVSNTWLYLATSKEKKVFSKDEFQEQFIFAFNFNSEAIEDDGSCEETISGCTDSTSFNYNPVANVNDESCVALIIGCMSDLYIEFNPLANSGLQELFCHTEIVFGCLDDYYIEFNSLANTDNESCLYTWEQSYLSLILNT